MKPLVFLLLAVLPAAPAAADGSAECAAQNIPSGGGCTATQFCSDLESCKTFCCCACDLPKLTGEWWNESAFNDQVACPRAPQTGAGLIAPDSGELKALATELRGREHIQLAQSGIRATAAVVQGLKDLDDALAAWPDPPGGGRLGLSVKNCYRRAIGNQTAPRSVDGNAEAICRLIEKTMHVENTPALAARVAEWHANAANWWMMAPPGPTPHSGGYACDVVLTDAAGADCFDVAAGPDAKHQCSIDSQRASKLMDEAVTRTGGRRLKYEAWHYEWGGPEMSCRCKQPASGSDAACDQSWPPTGKTKCG